MIYFFDVVKIKREKKNQNDFDKTLSTLFCSLEVALSWHWKIPDFCYFREASRKQQQQQHGDAGCTSFSVGCKPRA